jgi:hypothetical protein
MRKYTSFGHHGNGQWSRSHLGLSGSSIREPVMLMDQVGLEVGNKVGADVGVGLHLFGILELSYVVPSCAFLKAAVSPHVPTSSSQYFPALSAHRRPP